MSEAAAPGSLSQRASESPLEKPDRYVLSGKVVALITVGALPRGAVVGERVPSVLGNARREPADPTQAPAPEPGPRQSSGSCAVASGPDRRKRVPRT